MNPSGLPEPPHSRGTRRVACFSPYPIDAPSLYHRIWSYRPHWKAHQIELDVWPFMTSGLYRSRRTFGPVATFKKMALSAFGTLRAIARVLASHGYDAIIIHREILPLGPPLLETWMARRHPNVIFDLDDAMWHPPSNAVFQRGLFWDANRVAKVMRACRHVVAGNDYIGDYARAHNDNVVIIPTSYDDIAPESGVIGRASPSPVVVWIGNLGNACYVREILPALEAVAARHPFRLRLIGGNDIAEVRSDRLAVEYLIWQRHLEAGWLQESDVGIMPLPDLPFERGKCAFKIVQYFSAGLPAVASPVGMNAHVIRGGYNGFLADDAASWAVAVHRLVSDATLRQQLATGARQTYLDQFTREVNAVRWLQLLL